MPSFNNAVPQLPKRFDLRDVVDHVDRLLEVLDQAVAQSQGQVYPLTIDPVTGAAYAGGSFPRPGYIQTADVTTYENILTQGTVAACVAANAAFGAKELLATLQAKLSGIEALNADFVAPGF